MTAWIWRAKPIAMALLLLGAAPAQIAPTFQGVQTSSAPGATTLVVRMSAPVTHIAYRPSPNVFLVDMPNASVPANAAPTKLPQGPVNTYRVYNYRQATGQGNMLRLELSIAPGSKPSVEVKPGNLLVVRVVAAPVTQLASRPAPAPARPAIASAPAATLQKVSAPVPPPMSSTTVPSAFASAAVSSRGPSRLIDLEMEANDLGTAVLIKTSGPVRYHAYPVYKPYRFVVDFLRTGYGMKRYRWPVSNSPINDIRGSQFTASTARIVLDLKEGVVPVISRAGNVLELDVPSTNAAGKSMQPLALQKMAAASHGPAGSLSPATAGGSPVMRPAAGMKSGVMSGKSTNGVETGSFERGTEGQLKPASFSANSSQPGMPVAGRPLSASSAARPLPLAGAKPAAASAPGVQPRNDEAKQPMLAANNAPLMPPARSASSRPEPPPRGMAPASMQQPLQGNTTGNLQGLQYTGERITLNLKNADLKDFFRLIHEVSGLNVVVDPNVTGSVTMVVEDVPWDQALDIVLRNNQLGRELEGNVVRIATVSTLQNEAKAQAELDSARQKAAPLVTEVKQISYANAADLISTLKKFSGERGDITPDPRTNTLIIEAPADILPTLNQLVARLDQKTPQVEVEARVVAATRNFSRELGVQLGFGTGNSSSTLGGSQQVGVGETTVGGLSPKYAVIGAGNLPLNVNLPANAPTSGISFINASNTFRIDAVLTAAEQKGLGHVLSRPKIVTQNNAQAVVQQGVKIPVQTTINNTISVQFFSVTLRLTVTPQITSDRTVFMNVDVENDQIDPGIPRVNGIPAIDTQGATTKVLVADGGTVVIGGVMINNSQNTLFQVPVLGSLPVVGNLFKHTSVSNNSQELLFFITPHIV